MALTKAHNRMIANAAVNVKDYGATGDGTTNDTVAIQAAIDAVTSGGTVYFPAGTYRIARTLGTNDAWGIKITASNVRLLGDSATLRRFNTDISTYALAYPILLVGTPDNNSATQTENIVIDGLTFQGEDTRHALAGNTPSDKRYAIDFKNSKNTVVKNCAFTDIDSQAINYQYPTNYDYRNSVYYNTTKNYDAQIVNCRFIAQSHTTANRALIHAIQTRGVDRLSVMQNYFEWCDDCISGETTYDALSDTEDDTYTPTVSGWSLGAVKRTGRGLIVSNNQIINSSEHAIYASGMDVEISGNVIRAEAPAYCFGDIKIRAKNVTVSNNIVSVAGEASNAIAVNEPSFNVTVTGNTLYLLSSSQLGLSGAISVNSIV